MVGNELHPSVVYQIGRVGREHHDAVPKSSSQIEENDVSHVAAQGQSELTDIAFDVGSDQYGH